MRSLSALICFPLLLHAQDEPVRLNVLSPDKRFAAVDVDDGFFVIDRATRKKLFDLEDYAGGRHTAKWSSDATLLAVSFSDSRLSGSTLLRRVTRHRGDSVSYQFIAVDFSKLRLDRYLRRDPESNRDARWGVDAVRLDRDDVLIDLRSLSPPSAPQFFSSDGYGYEFRLKPKRDGEFIVTRIERYEEGYSNERKLIWAHK